MKNKRKESFTTKDIDKLKALLKKAGAKPTKFYTIKIKRKEGGGGGGNVSKDEYDKMSEEEKDKEDEKEVMEE